MRTLHKALPARRAAKHGAPRTLRTNCFDTGSVEVSSYWSTATAISAIHSLSVDLSFHLCRHLRQERVVVRQARGMFTELSIDIINANDQLMSKFIHLRR
ncbi:unnamed protein product [Prorocentrum cordatum]|uniref:Uncharacterized protein n=1 Tax=Prorocentrum cordatum TaxID=2364126 RepID=A0ABN9TRX7_9DINO|nr:unnamed protein product [Polarella glacialis]